MTDKFVYQKPNTKPINPSNAFNQSQKAISFS